MPRTTRPINGASDQPKPRRPAAKKSNGAAHGATHGGGNGGVSNEEVARRAYEIYESRGGQHGADLDHWLEAERQLKAGSTSMSGSIAAARPKKTKKTPEAGV